MRPKATTVEEIAGALASRQHGVVARGQLAAAGLTPAEIKHRVAAGALIRQYRGVYRVGHQAPSTEARYMAAFLAAGDGAVLSGRAAGHVHGLLRGGPPAAEITSGRQRRIHGVRTRRAQLRPIEMTTVRAIPITTVPRTIVDLAPVLDLHDLTIVCHEANVRYGTGPSHIAAITQLRAKSPPGIANLRRVMIGDIHVVLSELESGFLDELRGDRLPLPVTNRAAGGRRVDCRWPEYRLTVELLSYRFHNSRYSWEQDHERRREARKRGDEFRTYTWADVFEDPTVMLTELRDLLADHRRCALSAAS